MSNVFLTPGGRGYFKKVLSTESANLIAYWPLWEASGTVAQNLQGVAARNGAYTGVAFGNTGIGDGNNAPLFDGTNDYCNIYSTSLNSAFNGSEGTVSIWCKVSGAGVWEDSTTRETIHLRVNASNRLQIFRSTTNNRITFTYRAGGTSESNNADSLTSVGWLHLALSWSKTANAVKAYLNGTQTGSTLTIAGTWSGNLAATLTCIGAQQTTPAEVWDGYLAHGAIWTTPLSDSQISALASV